MPVAERQVRVVTVVVLALAFAAIATGIPFRHGSLDHPWMVGDWLIGYDGGFSRRGLLGDLFLSLSAVTGVLPGVFVFATSVTCYAVAFWFTARIALSGPLSTERLLVLLSPACILFAVHDMKGGFRKEVLLFAVLAPAVHAGLVRRVRPALVAGLVAAAMPLLVLAHEMLFCAVPFAVLLVLSLDLPRGRRVALAAAVAALSSLAFVAVLAAGTPDTGAICAAMTAAGQAPDVCTGAVDALADNASYGWGRVLSRILQTSMVWGYLVGAALAALPAVLLARRLARGGAAEQVRGVALATLATTLLFLPIFLVAIDWGRFIHVIAFCASLFLLALPMAAANDSRPRSAWAAFAIAVVYGALWGVDHFQGLEGPVAQLLRL